MLMLNNSQMKLKTMDQSQFDELVGALSTEDVDSVVAHIESLKRRCYDAEAFQKGTYTYFPLYSSYILWFFPRFFLFFEMVINVSKTASNLRCRRCPPERRGTTFARPRVRRGVASVLPRGRSGSRSRPHGPRLHREAARKVDLSIGAR